MVKSDNLMFWDENPNRDEVLERADHFLRALSEKDRDSALQYVMIEDYDAFEKDLESRIREFIRGWMEDEEMEKLPEDIIQPVTPISEIEEEVVYPEFEGQSFQMQNGEEFTIHLSYMKKATIIRMHFEVRESDSCYCLKFNRFSSNPSLPGVEF